MSVCAVDPRANRNVDGTYKYAIPTRISCKYTFARLRRWCVVSVGSGASKRVGVVVVLEYEVEMYAYCSMSALQHLSK